MGFRRVASYKKFYYSGLFGCSGRNRIENWKISSLYFTPTLQSARNSFSNRALDYFLRVWLNFIGRKLAKPEMFEKFESRSWQRSEKSCWIYAFMGNVEKMDTRKMCPKRGKVTPNANESSILFTNTSKEEFYNFPLILYAYFSRFLNEDTVLLLYTPSDIYLR